MTIHESKRGRAVSIDHRVFRAGIHAYLVMTIIAGLPTFYGLWVALEKPAAWDLTLVFGVFYVFLLIWAATFRIEITETELVLRSLLGGTKRIAHADVQRIRLGTDLSGQGGILRLFVKPKGRGAREISINAKVFTSEAVRAVLDLGKHVATANSGGLNDGIVAKAVRKRRSRKT
jgi:hypothetical protein